MSNTKLALPECTGVQDGRSPPAEAQRSQNANAVLGSIPAALSIADLSTENFSTPPPWQPVDFLSLAAYSRAHRYVQHVRDEQRKLADPKMTTRLICCTVFGLCTENSPDPFLWARSSLPQHHLLTTLLNFLEDPNVEAFDITVWKAYLMAMYNQNVKRDIYLKGKPLKLSNVKWISTTKAFIE